MSAPKPAEPGPRKASLRLALAWFAAAALLLLADGITTVRPSGLDGADTYFVVVHRSWTLSMPAAFALFGALYLGMTPGFPVRLKPGLGWAHLAVMAIGAALTKAPQFALLWAGMSKRDEDVVHAFDVWNGVATAGAVLMGLSLLLFFWALIDGLRRKPMAD